MLKPTHRAQGGTAARGGRGKKEGKKGRVRGEVAQVCKGQQGRGHNPNRLTQPLQQVLTRSARARIARAEWVQPSPTRSCRSGDRRPSMFRMKFRCRAFCHPGWRRWVSANAVVVRLLFRTSMQDGVRCSLSPKRRGKERGERGEKRERREKKARAAHSVHQDTPNL